ncbi:ABC transporter C family member 8-like protein [Tanacetum coccineum]
MKVIKLQSWEEKFKKITELFRETEFRWLRESQFKRAYGTVLYWMSPTLVSSVVFFGSMFLKSAPLDAVTIFTILAALRTMSEPVGLLPDTALIQVKVSFDRANSFLVDDELKDNTMTRDQELEDLHIRIQDWNFAWDPESHAPTLKNINLEVKCGQKVAVCGSVGAGKSSMLYAILGEISKTSGNVSVSGSIAYVSQTSWIQSGTIQDNILYGKPMNRTMYEKTIKACALDKYIEAFKHGDLIEIFQIGLNMSGGQKQRIQLARAVYSDADIYLLDDPFSAVDAHTAATLFNDYVMTSHKYCAYRCMGRCNTVTAPLADIKYRSSDGDWDIKHSVFRWDRTSYEIVFWHGFEVRHQANTLDETYYNLELYVNSRGRPLDTTRETTHCFISTTISNRWYPRVSSGAVEYVYCYEIYAPGGILVAQTLGERYRYSAQDEIVFPAGIAPPYIRSAQLFVLTGLNRKERSYSREWNHEEKERL